MLSHCWSRLKNGEANKTAIRQGKNIFLKIGYAFINKIGMRRKIKKISFTILLFISIFLLIATLNNNIFSETYDSLNKILNQHGIKFRMERSFSVIKDFKYPIKEKTIHSIIAQDTDTRIEIGIIKPLSQKEAINYIESKYIIIKSLYQPQVIPYSGKITHTADCPDKNKPKELMIKVMGMPIKVILAKATERYVLGVCEDNLIKQEAAFTVWYNPDKKILYQMTIFQPSQSFQLDNVLSMLKSLENIGAAQK
jgi:hypothetical protein